jgi:hypothetical protein
MFKPMMWLLLMTLFMSCSSEIDLTNQKYVVIAYDELPLEVQTPFKNIISIRNWGDGTNDTLVNLTELAINYSQNTMMFDLWETIRLNGSYHRFVIEGKHYILRANKGDPFVIYQNNLYHIDNLNAAGDDYLTSVYHKYSLK